MKNIIRRAAASAVLLLMLVVLSSCSKITSGLIKVHTHTFYPYFDTVGTLSSYALDKEEEFNQNAAEVNTVLEHWHRLLDIYNEYEGMSNLCTVNRLAGQAVKVDPDLIAFVKYAKDMCILTKGEMDISLGAVLRLWHEASIAEKPYVPAEQDLREAAKHTGFDLVEIDESAGTLRLTDTLASLDAGALGKGYAAERAAELLSKKGVTGYGLNLGGNIRFLGSKADESPFTVGIRDPLNPEELALTLNLSDCSCVTSGDYERYFTVDGRRYCHIIDKDTLMPASYFTSVSVICKDSGLADALTTALFCMSFEDGFALISSLEGVDAVWIWIDSSIRYTMGLDSVISLV